jgi:hypothetical protein
MLGVLWFLAIILLFSLHHDLLMSLLLIDLFLHFLVRILITKNNLALSLSHCEYVDGTLIR